MLLLVRAPAHVSLGVLLVELSLEKAWLFW